MAWFDPSSHSSTGPLSQPTPKPMQPGQRPEEGYFQSRSSLSKGHRNELKKAINFAVKLTPQFTKSLFFLLPKSVAGMKTTKHSMATAATAALSAKTQIHDLDGRWSSAASSSVTNETNQFIIQCNSPRVGGKHPNVQESSQSLCPKCNVNLAALRFCLAQCCPTNSPIINTYFFLRFSAPLLSSISALESQARSIVCPACSTCFTCSTCSTCTAHKCSLPRGTSCKQLPPLTRLSLSGDSLVFQHLKEPGC